MLQSLNMHRSKLFSVFVIVVMIGGLSIVGCSQKGRGQGTNTQVQGNAGQDSKGQWVVVDGERVFVPEYLIDKRFPRRMPEKIAREILKGREIIRSGNASTDFKVSRLGTEIAVSDITFDPDEPQTPEEQFSFVHERVDAFNKLLRDGGMTPNDTVTGSGAAMLIALKVFGKVNAVAESKSWQERFELAILKDEAYQGRSEEEKQANYEIRAYLAIEALNYTKIAKGAKTAGDRDAAQKKARSFAESLYKLMTNEP